MNSKPSMTPCDHFGADAFLYRRLETLPETRGRFRLHAALPIASDDVGQLEVEPLCADSLLALELDVWAKHWSPRSVTMVPSRNVRRQAPVDGPAPRTRRRASRAERGASACARTPAPRRRRQTSRARAPVPSTMNGPASACVPEAPHRPQFPDTGRPALALLCRHSPPEGPADWDLGTARCASPSRLVRSSRRFRVISTASPSMTSSGSSPAMPVEGCSDDAATHARGRRVKSHDLGDTSGSRLSARPRVESA